MGIAACSGGTGAPNVGLDVAATYGAGRLAQMLVAGGVSELSAWLPLLGVVDIVYSSFCANDPPTMVAMTQAESDAIAAKSFTPDFFTGIGKFKDIMLNLIWHEACSCTGGAQVYTAPPAVNVNTPVYQFPVLQSTAPCATAGPYDYFPSGSNSGGIGGPAFVYAGEPVSSFVWTVTNTATTAPGYAATVRFQRIAANGTTTDLGISFSVPVGGTVTQVVSWDPAWPMHQFNWLRGAGSGASTLTVTEQTYCNGQAPGGTISPCCPPDAATLATLEAIMATVTLIQRQAVPFGYIASTAHAGLSGASALSIAGLLGVKVAVTTLPSSYGVQGSSPPEHFDLGYVTFGTADGFPSAYRLQRNPQVMLPARCSVYTDLDYDLAPGVVVTITELVREP